MYFALFVPLTYEYPDGESRLESEELIFSDIKEANSALKKYKGSRMKTFDTKDKALAFINNPDKDESFIDPDSSSLDIVASLEKLSLDKGPSTEAEEFPSAKPALLNQLRRQIEAGEYEKVEEIIWSIPRYFVTMCDSAVYLYMIRI